MKEAPDLYLEELKDGFEELFGIQVSISTIWRALTRGGYTMKRVSIMFYIFVNSSNVFYAR
jgi:hypothetical protein